MKSFFSSESELNKSCESGCEDGGDEEEVVVEGGVMA